MTTLQSCPVCQGTTFDPYLDCIDYTVSKKTFAIQKCRCGFLFTNPRPADDDLPAYYESAQYISHTDRGATLLDKIYLLARTQTLRWKKKLVSKPVMDNGNPKTLLDIGCGTGDFLKTCQSEGWTVQGIEPSTNARQIATRKLNTTIYQNLGEISGQSFSVITLWHVLEHIPNLNQDLARIASLLDKGGMLFIAVPNHKSRDGASYNKYWAGYDVPRHLWHFDRQSMSRLLSSHNLKLKEIIPMKLDSYYVSLLSESYKNPGARIQNMVRGFWGGLQSNTVARKTGEYSSLIYVVTQ